MEPTTTAALISAGSSLLGGLFGRKERKADTARQDYWNQQSLDFEREKFSSGIQTRVKDAKKAGIHPLYALGAPGAGSPSFSTGASESGLGRGIANAGAAIANMGRRSKMSPEERALHEASLAQIQSQTEANSAVADFHRSNAARVQQQTAATAIGRMFEPGSGRPLASALRSTKAGGGGAGRDGERIRPPGGDRVPVRKRPTVEMPNVDMAEFFPIGDRGNEIINPDLGMDEIGQVYYAWQKARELLSDWAAKAYPKGRKHPKTKYKPGSMLKGFRNPGPRYPRRR